MTWFIIAAVCIALFAAIQIIGLLHGLLCLWLIEVSDYNFEKVTQRRVTLNGLNVARTEQKRRDRKRRAAFQLITADQVESPLGRSLAYVANFLIFVALTLSWVLKLALPIMLVWLWVQQD